MSVYQKNRFDFEFFPTQEETDAFITVLDSNLRAILKNNGAMQEQNFYFDHSTESERRKVRLNFLSRSTGEKVFQTLKENGEQPFKIVHSPSRMLSDLISGSKAAHIFEDFSCNATPALVKWMEEIENGDRKIMSLAFDLMSVQILSSKYQPALKRGGKSFPLAFLTYKSHADGFFVMSKSPEATKNSFESRYQKISASAQQRILELKKMIDENSLPDDLKNWQASMSNLREKSLSLINNGEIYFSQNTGYMGDRNDLSASSFHQTIQKSLGFQWFMKSNPAFLTTRLVVGLQYLSLHRLGLPLLERYFLCHTISAAIQQVYEVDAEKALEDFLVKSLTPKYCGPFLSPFVSILVRRMPKMS